MRGVYAKANESSVFSNKALYGEIMKTSKSKNSETIFLKSLVVVGLLTVATACGSATVSSGSSSSSTTAASDFPADLAVASPLDTTADDGSTDLTQSSLKFTSSGSFTPTYAWATAQINEVLNAGSAALCTFDPELFISQESDADCYGPSVLYQDHPDSSVPGSGELLPHDVGIWQATDTTTGHACMAAELNARMSGARNKSLVSLSGLASMVCVINNSGGTLTMPSSSTLDLTTDMNALGISDVTFTTATISEATNSDGNSEYSYHMEIAYAPAPNSYNIVVDMDHVPGSLPSEEYSGQVSYLVSGLSANSGCPPDSIATHNASLQYVRHAVDDMDVQVRSAYFCGENADGRDSDNLVDPADKYIADTNPNGWGYSFDILTANYDPTTLNGDYAYSWQAGAHDDNSRVFNVHVQDYQLAAANETVVQSFYGFGDDVETADGSIGGFICNWYGPGYDHTLIANAQYQAMGYETTTGTFLGQTSNITYAPTVSCEYDGSGSFIYDTNGDGDLSDESNVAVSQDLYPAADVDGDGIVDSIFDTIKDTGFSLPTI